MAAPTMDHLLAHHGDFAAFRDAMIETSAGRFGPIWWGVLEQHIQAAPDAAVVDLGTGPGLLLEMLRERLPQAQLTGVEIQPEMLQTAREVAGRCGARVVEADLAGPIPLPDGCADVVTAVMVFHELVYPPALMAEAARLLKPGGSLVIYDWVKRPLRDYLRDRPLTPELLQHFREHCLFSSDDLAFLATREGLEIREVVGRRGGNFAILVASRPDEG